MIALVFYFLEQVIALEPIRATVSINSIEPKIPVCASAQNFHRITINYTVHR